MKNRAKSTFRVAVVLLCLGSGFQVSADMRTNYAPDFGLLTFDGKPTLIPLNLFETKRGDKYDESKDPALRRGTENTEQPQSSFFAIPALVVGIIGIVLFLNKE